MNKYPVQRQKQAVSDRKEDAVEVVGPIPAQPFLSGNRFFSFQYSCSEVSSQGDKTVIKSRKTSYENGKLRSEAFEGTLDRQVHEQMIDQAEHFVQSQTSLLLSSLSLFLPFRKKLPPKQD